MFCAQILFDLVILNFDSFDLGLSDELRAWHIQRTCQF